MKRPMNNPSGNSFFMLRFFKKLAVLAVLLTGVQVSHGFALLGPFEPYQTPAFNFNPAYLNIDQFGDLVVLGDLGGPHNIAEEFRRNTPVMYYACDATYWEYFGSNGVAAVDQAFGIMNSLTNVSAYSADLSEFPLKSQQMNYEAQNLYLTDVKSMTLHLLVEQMGLSQPERFTWTMHARIMGSPCPLAGEYLIIKRNFDILQTSLNQTPYSSYVNGVLYTYGVLEYCTGTPIAETIPYAVDPTAETYTSVAADPGPHRAIFSLAGFPGFNPGGVGLNVGGYYTYLTRDDVAGLRYLLRADNYNPEASGVNTVQFVTNNTPLILTNLFDLGLLADQAATNSAANLQALYPGLLVEDTTNWFALGWNTNISLVVTSSPFWPAGTFSVIAVTNREPFPITYFGHTFGNIITNSFSPRRTYRTQTILPSTSPFAPAGSPTTLATNTSGPINIRGVSGSFYLIPTNFCAIKILGTLFTNVVATTNIIASTPIGGDTNQTVTVSTITYFTNNWLIYLPVTCPENTVALRQGVERVQFQRRDFDSLIGAFWAPATNRYTLVELTNNALRPQLIERVVRRPDFLFTASDQGLPNTYNGTVLRDINFNRGVTNGLVAGPGTVTSPTTINFNKIGASYWNLLDFNLFNSSLLSPLFVSDETTAIQGILWASFDGTTNAPVLYPNGTSLASFVSQLFLRVSTQPAAVNNNGIAQLPDGNHGAAYLNTLSVTGGLQPYTWSLAPGSSGFPGGLNFVNVTNTGESIQLSTGAGTLTAAPATYDFTVRVTDAASRFVDMPFALTINP